MTSLVERAIEKARTLPAESQNDLARMLLQAIGEPLPAADLTAAMRSREAAERNEFATDSEMRAIWAKHGQ